MGRCATATARRLAPIAQVDRSDTTRWSDAAHAFAAAADTVSAAGADTPLWQLLAAADEAGGKLQLRFAPVVVLGAGVGAALGWGAAAVGTTVPLPQGPRKRSD